MVSSRILRIAKVGWRPALAIGPKTELKFPPARSDAFEIHYTPEELAKLWKLDPSTIRRMFRDEVGVMKYSSTGTSEGLKFSTVRKYRNTLNHLAAFSEKRSVDSIAELTMDQLDAFRASRKLKPITSSKELQLLRQFCGFSFDRRWSTENVAKRIKPPRNIKPNDVESFSLDEVKLIIKACDHIGRGQYERLRVRAMVLTLRYTALRIGDVAMLARDRFSKDSGKWRIFLRTEKSGKPVFLPIPTELKAALDRVPIPRGAAPDCRHYFWNGISSERTMKDTADRSLSAVFKSAMVPKAHAHRFRHTLATELLGNGASFEEVADILGNSPEIVRKHYAKWSPARQSRIDDLMERVHVGVNYGDENQTLQ